MPPEETARAGVSRILTVQEMRALDRAAIEDYHMPVLLLMENAGRAAAEAVMKNARPGAKILILAGPGNNGGDGVAAGRLLLNAGRPVEIVLAKGPAAFRGDAEQHYRMAQSFGVAFLSFHEQNAPAIRRKVRESDILVDALLGTGTQGKIREPYAAFVRMMNESGKRVISIDVPSGLDADTGDSLGETVRAYLTVTMGAAKKGLVEGKAREYVGKLIIADIGFPRALLKRERKSECGQDYEREEFNQD